MNSVEKFNYLLERYLENNISLQEHDEFFEMIDTGKFDDILDKSVQHDFYEPCSNDIPDMPDHIGHEILREILKTKASIKDNWLFFTSPLQWLSAVSVVLLTAVIIFLFQGTTKPTDKFVSTFISQNPNQIDNETDHTLPVLLPDGSKIILQPSSSLYYSKKSFNKSREVYLEGEAKFTITKNPLQPFYVYYNNVVTKVLGTSFNMRTNKLSGDPEVEVMEGKVQLYENEKILGDSEKVRSVIVTPNQKAVYKKDNRFFESTISDKPINLIAKGDLKAGSKPKQVSFIYENAHLLKVLNNLEENYGIEIIVSNEALYNCVFSGDITKQDLFEKLNIICIVTNSAYEINGTKILVTGNGCN